MNEIKGAATCFLGILGTFFGQYGLGIGLVLLVVVLDVLSGMMKAKITGEGFSSTKGTVGFWKKLALLLGLLFGISLDAVIPFALKLGVGLELPFAMPFGLVVAAYIILNESISICENLYACNDKMLPDVLVRILKLAREDLEKKEG